MFSGINFFVHFLGLTLTLKKMWNLVIKNGSFITVFSGINFFVHFLGLTLTLKERWNLVITGKKERTPLTDRSY